MENKCRKVRLFLIYLVFVLVNMAVNRLVKAAGLPLYVDNIGTLLGAVLGGYLPGIFVGYVTNIFNATADISNLYYAGISVLIAITATFFAKRGFFDRFWKSLITIPFLAFFGGVAGSVLTYFIYGAGELSFWQQILADYRLDLIDKAITVVGFYAVKSLLPDRFIAMINLTDWKQKPMSNDEIRESRGASKRGFSLRRKITLLICVIMLFVAVVTTAISYFLYKNFSMQQHTAIGRSIATTVAITIDPDRVDDYLFEDGTSEDYKKTERDLYRIRDSADLIEYIYVYQIREDGCHVVFDLDTEEVKGNPIGTIIPFDESFKSLLPKLLAGEPIDPIITDDTYGWLLTDYEPIYDSNGKCVCYACADINMEDIRSGCISFLARIVSLFAGFFILILVFVLWFSDYHLIYPIDAMTFASGEFAYNSESDLELSVKRLSSLKISTEDEIENLYSVLVKTISDTVGYLEDVKQKGEQIENMQNGLIYILADLVESRDKCTGDHVRNTAAYVKLILDLLQENGLYADEIDEEFVKDVYNSAPLHDVGKIKVPDAILNKPGKLDDDEFAEMKKHTTAGKEIIESAMELVGESGYLSEALDLATYHHEKWNGTGYPKGLKGEEIPLCARIMAVSDVFDALMSKRSYKKPFTFEQAMNIIKEGSGSHFDPVIADLFVENSDRVKALLEENERAAEQKNDSERS